MLRKLVVAILAAACVVPSVSTAGPLTNVLVNSIDKDGRIEWAEGYQEGRVETLNDVIVRMHDGRRIDIGKLVMDYSGAAMTIDATDVRLNPEGNILRLSADSLRFEGGAKQLRALWSPATISDTCVMTGPTATVVINDLGLILADADAVFDDDNQYRIRKLELVQSSEGNKQSCSTAFDFSVEGYEADMGDGSRTLAQSFSLGARLPGNLASLAANPDHPVAISGRTETATNQIFGGATAWAINSGAFEAEFPALDLVPALTLALQNRGAPVGAEFLMRLWNSLSDLDGTMSFKMEDMVLRTANVLPPGTISKLTESGLTTVFVSSEGKSTIESGVIDLQAEMSAVGLMVASLDTKMRIGTYPDRAISLQASNPSFLNAFPPLHVDDLVYRQKDNGLLQAASDVMGVPVTVKISQIREKQTNLNSQASPVIRKIATAFATFANDSYRVPPARLQLSIDKGIDLREAMIISSRAPEEILEIFDYKLSSAEDE